MTSSHALRATLALLCVAAVCNAAFVLKHEVRLRERHSMLKLFLATIHIERRNSFSALQALLHVAILRTFLTGLPNAFNDPDFFLFPLRFRNISYDLYSIFDNTRAGPAMHPRPRRLLGARPRLPPRDGVTGGPHALAGRGAAHAPLCCASAQSRAGTVLQRQRDRGRK